MEYLEKEDIVHCDVCASNILLDDNDVAKICDFGLAEKATEMTKKSIINNKIRVRWSAPELLDTNRLTIRSDVWSFGILIWEIYTYGRIPYPHMKAEEISEKVKNGYRMSKPDTCSDKVYEIMLSCWKFDWSQRPSFTTLRKELHKVK